MAEQPELVISKEVRKQALALARLVAQYPAAEAANKGALAVIQHMVATKNVVGMNALQDKGPADWVNLKQDITDRFTALSNQIATDSGLMNRGAAISNPNKAKIAERIVLLLHEVAAEHNQSAALDQIVLPEDEAVSRILPGQGRTVPGG